MRYGPTVKYSTPAQKHGKAVSIGQTDFLGGQRLNRCRAPCKRLRQTVSEERPGERVRVVRLARLLQRLPKIPLRPIGVAKMPEPPRPQKTGCNPGTCAKSKRECSMLVGIIQRYCAFQMRHCPVIISHREQHRADGTMPHQQ